MKKETNTKVNTIATKEAEVKVAEETAKADEKRQEELSDIQKELEAKFDELFGSIEP